MSKTLKLAFTFLLFMLPTLAVAEEYPKVERLMNGLKVMVIEDNRFPIVISNMYVKAGAINENENNYGISHFLEHLVFKGTKTFPKGVDKIVENSGGSLNAYTSYDQTVYFNEMPSDKWELSMECIQGLLFDPLFPPEEVEKERQVVIAEMKQRYDEPDTKLFFMTTKMSLNNTVYKEPVFGSLETMNSITIDDLKSYMNQFYNPSEMLLVVAGDVDSEKVFAKAKELFSKYPNLSDRNFDMPYGEEFIMNMGQGLEISIEKGDWNKAYINLSFPVPSQSNPESTTLSMLGLLLTFDDNSVLLQEFKFKDKLVDSIYAYTNSFERIGTFNIGATLDSANIPKFISKLTKYLAEFDASKFSDMEFEQAKNMLENIFWYKNKTIQSKSTFYGDNYFVNPSDILGKTYLGLIQNTNKEQINQTVKKYIKPESAAIAILLPNQANLDAVSLENELDKIVTENWPKKTKTDSQETSGINSSIIQIDNKTLILNPDKTIPFVTISINFLGGESLTDSADFKNYNTIALPSIAANVLTRAVKDMDAEKLTAFLSQKQISISASSAPLNFVLSAHGATKFSADIFKIITDVINEPSFAEDDLVKAKDDQILAVLQIQDSVPASLMTELSQFLFPSHAYGKDRNGSIEDINKISQKDLIQFWNKQKQEAMVISVAGDYDEKSIIEFVKSLPNPKYSLADQSIKTEQAVFTKDKDLYVPVEGRNQDFMTIVFPTVNRNHEDAAALSVLDSILGGFSGTLFQELREKRNLGYSAWPLFFSGERGGYLGFGIIASPEHRQTISQQFIAIVNMLRKNGISDIELERAKNKLQMDYVNRNQTAESRANISAIAVLFGHDTDYDKVQLEKILKVDKEAVNQVIKKYLVLENSYNARAGAK